MTWNFVRRFKDIDFRSFADLNVSYLSFILTTLAITTIAVLLSIGGYHWLDWTADTTQLYLSAAGTLATVLLVAANLAVLRHSLRVDKRERYQDIAEDIISDHLVPMKSALVSNLNSLHDSSVRWDNNPTPEPFQNPFDAGTASHSLSHIFSQAYPEFTTEIRELYSDFVSYSIDARSVSDDLEPVIKRILRQTEIQTTRVPYDADEEPPYHEIQDRDELIVNITSGDEAPEYDTDDLISNLIAGNNPRQNEYALAFWLSFTSHFRDQMHENHSELLERFDELKGEQEELTTETDDLIRKLDGTIQYIRTNPDYISPETS
jgi:hypothetical protein